MKASPGSNAGRMKQFLELQPGLVGPCIARQQCGRVVETPMVEPTNGRV